MKTKILYHEKNVAIRLKRRRGMRRIALSVSGDGSISLTAPRTTPLWYIERFLAKQSDWIERTLAKFGLAHVELEEKKATDRERYLEFREVARAFVEKRLEELNRSYGFQYSRVSIRNQRSRWGSCSAEGRLSFNYRILFLPPHLADYVLVHELAHLAELNHGTKFWALVGRAVPEYRKCRSELKHLKITALDAPRSER